MPNVHYRFRGADFCHAQVATAVGLKNPANIGTDTGNPSHVWAESKGRDFRTRRVALGGERLDPISVGSFRTLLSRCIPDYTYAFDSDERATRHHFIEDR